MAEPSAQSSPEVQLFARLKLQRVVFGAFAMVLVCLFAVGLSAYRRMQADQRAATEALTTAEARAKGALNGELELQREVQRVKLQLDEAQSGLGLAKCRLAIHEIRDGNPERAATLLAEARELGPPAWWPLVAHLSREQAVRFEGSDFPTEPVVAGAASADDHIIAVARGVQDGVQVELYGARDGRLLSTYPPQIPGAKPGAHLLLSADGSAWYMVLAGRAYYGTGGEVTVVPSGPIAGWDPVAPRAVDADPSLSVIYEAHGERGLVRRHRDDRLWVTQIVSLEPPVQPVVAVCISGGVPVIAAGAAIYALDAAGRSRQLHEFVAAPDGVALKAGPGVVYAAVLAGRELDLLAISDKVIATRRYTMPDEPVAGLRFLRDDTPVWIGVSGRVVTMDFQATQEWTLGGRGLSFIERHVSGLVFANGRGEFSVRTQPQFAKTGLPRHLVAPGVTADALAHGFVLTSERPGFITVQPGGVSVLPQAKLVALSPAGPAWMDEGLTLPGGMESPEKGSLRGAFADGSVLLFAAPKLKQVSAARVTECLLPEDRAPHPVVVAANANVAALRLGDTIYVATMQGDPQPVATRLGLAPDLVALDAGGTTIAIAYGAGVVVRSLRGSAESTLSAAHAPSQIALLFGGSVLATVETGQLVLYEVDGGRELMRTGESVTDIEASGEDSLNLVVGGRLCTLKLGD